MICSLTELYLVEYCCSIYYPYGLNFLVSLFVSKTHELSAIV